MTGVLVGRGVRVAEGVRVGVFVLVAVFVGRGVRVAVAVFVGTFVFVAVALLAANAWRFTGSSGERPKRPAAAISAMDTAPTTNRTPSERRIRVLLNKITGLDFSFFGRPTRRGSIKNEAISDAKPSVFPILLLTEVPLRRF